MTTMEKKRSKKTWETQTITRIAVLAALSAVLFMIEIPVVLFYKLDLSNVPVMLAGFSMGPLAGVMVLLVKDLLGLLHSSSMGVGELADFITAFFMLIPAVMIYKKNRTKKSALIGLGAGTALMVVSGVLVNMYIMIPFYQNVMGLEIEQIIAMGQGAVPFITNLWGFVLTITAPFNLLKGIIISAVTFLLYKRLDFLLKRKR